MTDSTTARPPALSLIAALAVAQALFGVFRALGLFEIGSDLLGRGAVVGPLLGALVFARGVLLAGIALLYCLFAWGSLNGRPWARTVGLIAATLNLLLVLSVAFQGNFLGGALLWSIVPVVVIAYLLSQPRAASA